MPHSNSPRQRSAQDRDDPRSHIFQHIPAGAESIDLADLEELYRLAGDPESDYGEMPDKWIIRAKIILRELSDLIRLDREKQHPIALEIIADLAFVATSVVGAEDYWIAYWCRKFVPGLSSDDIADLIDRAEPRHYYGDDIAKAFEITADERERFALSQVGACDDPDRVQRDAFQRARNAAYNRKHRAKNRTGRKPGRPKSDDPKPWEAAGCSRRTYFRRKARETGTETPVGTETPSDDLTTNSILLEKSHGVSVPRSESHTEPWVAAGVSRSTWYRQKSRKKVVYLTARSISIVTTKTGVDLAKAA